LQDRSKLVECRTLWGEPEQVHVQNMEQLHAHDCYQNLTEHKTSGHTIGNKIYRYAQFQHRKCVMLASPACMSCLVCMVVACTPRFSCRCSFICCSLAALCSGVSAARHAQFRILHLLSLLSFRCAVSAAQWALSRSLLHLSFSSLICGVVREVLAADSSIVCRDVREVLWEYESSMFTVL